MARINIEEKWWSDSRRAMLVELLKGNSREADGLWLQVCKLAQNHCQTGTIPLGELLALPGAELLIECDLVILIQANAKQTPSKAKQTIEEAKQDRAKWEQTQAYVRGSEENHGWLKKRREAGQKGGVSQTERVRDKGGKYQANTKQNEANESKGEQTCPSYSSSFSNKENTYGGIRTNYPQEFQSVWEAYDRKGDKKAAFEVYKKLKLTEEEQSLLLQAIGKYFSDTPDKKFRKDLERFLKTDWRETATSPAKGQIKIVPIEDIEKEWLA